MSADDLADWPNEANQPEHTLRIRPPLGARIYVVGFGVVWCGLVLAALIEALVHTTPAAVIPAGMLGLGGYIMWHAARLAVIGDEGGLTVRGYGRTRRIPKSEIEGFRIGSGFYPAGKCVMAMVRGEQVIALEVTRGIGRLARSSQRLERQLAELRDWLHTP